MERKKRRGGKLALPALITIAEVGALAKQCRQRVAARGRLLIDARAVARIDTAGLQLLAAVVADAARRGSAVEWSGPTEAFLTAARLSGFDRHLALGADNGAP